MNNITREFNELAQRLEKVKSNLKNFQAEANELQQRLQKLVDHQPFASESYAYMCSERKGGIDYMAIPALYGIDLEHYRKNSVLVWSLTRLPNHE